MSIYDAFYEHKKAQVMSETWGHLAPKVGVEYSCKMLFTQSETGDLIVIRSDFGDLPSSPWLFEDCQDFIEKHAAEAGQIYRFHGTYRKFENGSCRFVGKVTKVEMEV